MFVIAILIGIYSYLIFAIGLMNLLYPRYIIPLSLLFIIFSIFINKKSLTTALQCVVVNTNKVRIPGKIKLQYLLVSLLVIQGIINLIGALGPELGFDALWYHLTLPKLYLENHSIFHIPGGLLYYSVMPKLTEMLYIAAVAINGEVLAKLIHFSFGLLSSIALYKLSRTFFNPKISLIAVVVFYSNLVVGWQSITAYVDLARTFFEIMALWGFTKFIVNKDTPYRRSILARKVWLIISAIMLGLAISTKLLALGSLIIFSVLIAFHFFTSEESKSLLRHRPRWFLPIKNLFIGLFIYWVICLLIPLPWFVFSYINTGNPVYPFFTDIYKVGFNVEQLNPFRFVRDVWVMFMGSSDPISPIYIMFFPLVLIFYKRFRPEIKLITLYSFLAIVVWYLTPRTGGGRFILPYLPAFSIIAAAVIEKLSPPRPCVAKGYAGGARSHGFSFDFAQDQPATIRGASTWNLCVGLVVLISIISILYRGIANLKYIPVIIGAQSKSDFLEKHLNFSFGDFYDIDGYFKKHIKPKDTVLLYGFHNLYYVDFPFIDASWVKKGDSFNYIAVQNAPSADGLPKRFRDWELVYQNLKTNVKIYSKGEIKWAY